MAVVVTRTGASEHLLRMWERRYGAVTPTRGEGGHRRYSDADILRVRLLQAVTRAGRPIRQVARLSTDALARMAADDAAAQGGPPAEVPPAAAAEPGDVVGQAMALTWALNAPALDAVLRRAAARFGVPAFLDQVVAPLVRAVDQAWQAGHVSLVQERLVASTTHDLLVETMRALARVHAAERLVLATAPGVPGGQGGDRDRYAPGVSAVEAAAAGAAAAADGWAVVYLGPDLPAGEVAAVAAATAARAVAVHAPGYLAAAGDDDRARVADAVRVLRARLPAAVPVLVGGAGAPALGAAIAGPGVRVGAGWADLRAGLDATLGPVTPPPTR
ncbi:hypothetical protein tb265_45940 [Gemmatimonadetes bacterium T265]|nr:hypothetical protein tb265_45940 [Gemmatimonadetes bacterium T265]